MKFQGIFLFSGIYAVISNEIKEAFSIIAA